MNNTTLPAGAYLMWQAAARQRPDAALRDGIARYTERYGERPGVALVNEAEVCEAAGIEVRARAGVLKGNVWLGRAE